MLYIKLCKCRTLAYYFTNYNIFAKIFVMLLSMTGFGSSRLEYDGRVYAIEIKSLNAKTTELRCRLPYGFNDREFQIRRIVLEGAIRGRLELSITLTTNEGTDEQGLDVKLFKKYFFQLKELAEELNVGNADLISATMRIPGVTSGLTYEISEEEWGLLIKSIEEALTSLKNFRREEGKAMSKDLEMRIQLIKQYLEYLCKFEEARIQRTRLRLKRNLEEFISDEKIDLSRFEQEVLYYLEKLDISEEKLRLAQHCDYFIEQLNNGDEEVGKILSFIAQEVGREINTIGAKAQDSDIQQYVVKMKDELEKIKEQLANVL